MSGPHLSAGAVPVAEEGDGAISGVGELAEADAEEERFDEAGHLWIWGRSGVEKIGVK